MIIDGLSEGRLHGGDNYYSKMECDSQDECNRACLANMFCDFATLRLMDDEKMYCLLYDHKGVEVTRYNDDSQMWQKLCLADIGRFLNNLLVTNVLSHHYHLDESTFILGKSEWF